MSGCRVEGSNHMPDIGYCAVDPEVANTVAWLRGNGFDTVDSGYGDHDDPYPHVVMLVDPAAMVEQARRLAALLAQAGLEVADFNMTTEPAHLEEIEVRAVYDPVGNTAGLIVTGLDDIRLGGALAHRAVEPTR